MELPNIILIVILLSLVLECFPKRNFVMKITKIECIARADVININCTETKSNRVAGFNIFVIMSEDIYELRYDLEVKYKIKKGRWENFFKFKNIDVCEFVAAKFNVPILLIARNIMRKYSNYPEECPFKKDTVYYVQRMKMDPEQFPPYFPEGAFAASGILYSSKYKSFVDYKMEFLIESKNKRGQVS
ncbi:uncharacterized protein LOC129953600 [Eupeodes corollae]|uniref:uncharacterized protein LOC129953600 n=1 Tax=Eupeodes corollae TaxID=290404 RepID=UPI00248F5FFA|nr:uncharacterized protein LOC129953600 [Eupeodes corollae]